MSENFKKEVLNSNWHELYFHNMEFCENFLSALLDSNMDSNILDRFYNIFHDKFFNKEDKMIFYFSEKNASSFMIFHKFHHYCSFYIDLYQIKDNNYNKLYYKISHYKNIVYRDIPEIIKIALIIKEKEETKDFYTIEESYRLFRKFVDSHMERKYLKVFHNSSHITMDKFQFFKFVDEKDNYHPYLIINNFIDSRLYIFHISDSGLSLSYELYFEKVIQYKNHDFTKFIE